jgi:L-amino acid N-acyltransferase YncA
VTIAVRGARLGDAAGIRDVYEPMVTSSAITFETSVPTVEEMRARMSATSGGLPWLVAERAGEVVGYAYASPYRSRPAYRWCVETSVYLRADAQGQGLGRRLYEPLLDVLTRQRLVTAIAMIALPNPASVALHESLGFQHRGAVHDAGYKLGRWHDVGWWQRRLAAPAASPAEPLPLADVGWPDH